MLLHTYIYNISSETTFYNNPCTISLIKYMQISRQHCHRNVCLYSSVSNKDWLMHLGYGTKQIKSVYRNLGQLDVPPYYFI